MLSTTGGAAQFWFLSFLWGWLVALPQSLLTGAPRAAVPPLGIVGKAWVGVFAAGFMIEGMADVQKLAYKNGLKDGSLGPDAPLWCGTGVW